MKKSSGEDDLAAWIRAYLAAGRPGDRLPTMRDLMKRFGVAQRVVERVLKPEIAAGRLVSRRGAGVSIAEVVEKQTEYDADLLILYRLSESRLANTLLQELEQRLKARGIDILKLGYSSEDQAQAVMSRMGRFRCCLIQLHFETLPIRFLAALTAHADSIVLDGISATGIGLDAIGTNWREPLAQAFRRLRGAGHTKIAYFTSGHPARQIAMARREYERLCAAEGLESWLLETDALPGGYRSSDLVDSLTAQREADGNLPFTALIAWGVVDGYMLDRALRDLEIVPGRDLSVVVLGSTDFPSEHLRRFDVCGNRNDEKIDLFERVVWSRVQGEGPPPQIHYLPVHFVEHGSVVDLTD
ncbi:MULTISPECIES: substrate-binding domain-containing protein [Thioclava]|uniref:substrate-binding domain-containing protein n=1 Tax=Thioclava TaxID=285107 RepID=UPI0023A7BF2A|nr:MULTISPECIES: substrate-binding domain-containing protein [Thioclava]|tara:strand:+ start:539 stop:1609 length:1071 start_codon:yes stop_codon:yes gene_type:complete